MVRPALLGLALVATCGWSLAPAARPFQEAGSPADAHIRRVEVARIGPRPSVAPQPGLYGELGAAPRTDAAPVTSPSSAAATWTSKPFATLVTELSPAVLYSTTRDELTFFNGIEAWGHEGPTHMAMPTPGGVAVAAAGGSFDGARQSEAWVLVWFAGARGWRFDVPWLIVLQHRTRRVTLDRDGLRLQFTGPGGRVVAMPFYGYYKAPVDGMPWPRRLEGAVDMGIDTRRWSTEVPSGVVARARWWAEVLRRFPVRAEETFRVDRLHDVLTVRTTVEFLDIEDDWDTPPRTLAPLPPTLALALVADGPRFPLRVSAPVVDPFVMTPHGPYMGIEGQRTYEVEFETLRYVHETERDEPPPRGAPALVTEADRRLQQTAARRWASDTRMPVDHGAENFAWAAMGDRFYPMALPYIRDEGVGGRARASLQAYFRDWVLQDARFRPYEGPVAAWRGRTLLEGPGIGSWGMLGDAGKFSENLYSALWAYAHYTGDIATVKARWDLVRRLDITPLESGWKGVGRSGIAELGDQAAPPIDYARLAWMAGDIDTYSYQCYIATRELLQQFVKQRGAGYFRRLQPYHEYFVGNAPPATLEAMPANVFLTTLHGGTEGWQVDGPTYPRRHGERQFQNRWVRFSHASVARFYRDHLDAADLRAELGDWQVRHDGVPGPGADSQWLRDDPHIMPSLVRLRSLVLDGPLDTVARLATRNGNRAPFETWRLYPDAAVFASAWSIIRLSHPRHHDRLIPRSGPPGPYLLGLERSVPSQWSVLVQQLETWTADERLDWPVVGWSNWRTPRQPSGVPGASLFSFGAVTPRRGAPPRAASEWLQLNWNSHVVWYEP
jgi:hypothetical protein